MNWPFAFDDVIQIVAYKRDELTTDLICCDVVEQATDGPRAWFFHEEWEGFDALMAALQDRFGFSPAWRNVVNRPHSMSAAPRYSTYPQPRKLDVGARNS